MTDPAMYGTISATAAARVEVAEPNRHRAFSMAVAADDRDGSDGRPTSWSASLDALAFGTDIRSVPSGIELLSQPDPRAARLFVVSAGNVPWDLHGRGDYLETSDTSRIQSPAQAWNALTVGACTELTQPPSSPEFRGWTTVAAAGELSPFSRTSMTFPRSWPIKPDVVLEGGNLIISPGGAPDAHDDLSLLTTSNNEFRLLTTANATSAATAQAARLAAIAMASYPSLWPEAIRALLVHSAEWTPAMRRRIDAARSKEERLRLIRRYGWGVPSQQRVTASASSSVTLIIRDEFLPFEREERDLDARAAPASPPLACGAASRSVRGGSAAPGHAVILRGTESVESRLAGQVPVRLARPAFRRQAADGEPRRFPAAHRQRGGAGGGEFSAPGTQPDDRWEVGARTRNVGSLHADIWNGTGAELADGGYVGVTPVGGWWKDNRRRDRIGLPVRYALLVSLRTEAVAADIYTPIAAQIGIPIEIVT